MTDVIITAPLHEETRGKIRTHNSKLVPTWWMAWRDGAAGLDDTHGFGFGEQEAIGNLLELERR